MAHSLSQLTAGATQQPEWTTDDASLGVGKGPWVVQIFGQNITNVNKSLFTTSTIGGPLITETPMRPRVLGVRFDYKFSDAK
jgi:hypothetical protein